MSSSFLGWCVLFTDDRRLFRVFTAGGSPANVDARLANNSEDQLVASLSSLTLSDTDRPLRPGFGVEGKVIKLRTNFFPVRVPKGPLYEHDVKITPAGQSASHDPLEVIAYEPC